MTSKITLGLAALALGLSGAVQAQVAATEQHVDTNGGLHTTTAIDTPAGTTEVHRVDRPDGTAAVTKHEVNENGDFRTSHHEVGSPVVHVCHTKYHSHGDRYVHCTRHYH